MEDGMCILYYCYGLNIESVPVSEADKRAAKICELAKGEAGKDARRHRTTGPLRFGRCQMPWALRNRPNVGVHSWLNFYCKGAQSG